MPSGALAPLASDDMQGAAAPDGAEVPYGAAIMKATHNAYDRDEPLFDQLVYHRIRSLELDVHTSRSGTDAPASDWFVYHADVPFMRDSSCSMLSDCLGQIAAFHAAVPRHEVVTLFVDLKDDFKPGHSVAELDAALEKALGPDALVRPKDLLAACPGASSLRAAVHGSCAFPKLGALRGKIVVAATGGLLCDRTSTIAQYAGGDATPRLGFVAPELSADCPIERYDERPDVVFLNMALRERSRLSSVRARGLVARVYGGGLEGGLDTAAEFSAANAAGAQLLATDKVNADADAWSTTTSRRGWPFRCAGCDADVEAADLIAVRAQTGDLGSDEDSAYFAYEASSGESTWTTFLSVPSSNVEPLAKGCLMARASEAADAAAVAVCRPLDQDPPRVLVRRTTGAIASWVELQDVAGVSAETPPARPARERDRRRRGCLRGRPDVADDRAHDRELRAPAPRDRDGVERSGGREGALRKPASHEGRRRARHTRGVARRQGRRSVLARRALRRRRALTADGAIRGPSAQPVCATRASGAPRTLNNHRRRATVAIA
jgi:hypothetical protein